MANGLITSGTNPKALWPGIMAFWGRFYPEAEKTQQWKNVFAVKNSTKHREELQEFSGFGLAKLSGEGLGVPYDSEFAGSTTVAYHAEYKLGYQVTRREIDDNQYAEVSETRTRALAQSMAQTNEVVCANMFNRAFNSSYTFGDGKALIDTAHTSMAGAFSNQHASNAQLSEAALESMLIQIRNVKDSRGKRINLAGQKLIIPNTLQFQAHRILNSAGRIYDGSVVYRNDENALKTMGMLPQGSVVWDYLSSSTAWFITTNTVQGPTYLERVPVEIAKDSDFETDNAKVKAYMRFSVTNADPRAVFGSQGL